MNLILDNLALIMVLLGQAIYYWIFGESIPISFYTVLIILSVALCNGFLNFLDAGITEDENSGPRLLFANFDVVSESDGKIGASYEQQIPEFVIVKNEKGETQQADFIMLVDDFAKFIADEQNVDTILKTHTIFFAYKEHFLMGVKRKE